MCAQRPLVNPVRSRPMLFHRRLEPARSGRVQAKLDMAIMATAPNDIAPSRTTVPGALRTAGKTAHSYQDQKIQKCRRTLCRQTEYAIACKAGHRGLVISKEGHPKKVVRCPGSQANTPKRCARNVVKPAQMCLKLAGVANATLADGVEFFATSAPYSHSCFPFKLD